MPTVTTTVSTAYTRRPYQGLASQTGELTHVPRAEIQAYAASQTIAATGAGDNQYVDQVISLPVNSAYCLVDLGVSIAGAAGAANHNFPQELYCFLQDAASSATLIVPLELTNDYLARAVVVNVPYRFYTPRRIPQVVIPPSLSASQVTMEIAAYNATANDGAYAYSSFARFLEFGIEQALNWQVNTPTPVR